MQPLDEIFVLLEHLVRTTTTAGDQRLAPFVLEVKNRHETETWSFRPARDDGRFFVPLDDGPGRARIQIPAWALRSLVSDESPHPLPVEGDVTPLVALASVMSAVRSPLSVRFSA